MKVSKCCTAIPWNDTDICAECMDHADFEEYVENKGQGMNKKILKLIKSRLDEGEQKYGHENVETDGRNFTTEALEEALDCAVYLAAKLIEIQTRNGVAEDAHAGVEELARMENNESIT